jgi:hypothetical protein
MDDQLLLDTVRSLETYVAVSASVAARALGTTEFVLQPAVDRLVACGALHVSVLRARAHPGMEFATRRVWYHTPDGEVAARFGMLTERPRPTRRVPDAQTPALAS